MKKPRKSAPEAHLNGNGQESLGTGRAHGDRRGRRHVHQAPRRSLPRLFQTALRFRETRTQLKPAKQQ